MFKGLNVIEFFTIESNKGALCWSTLYEYVTMYSTINIVFNNLSMTIGFPNWHFVLPEDTKLVLKHVGGMSLIFMYN